MEVSSPKGGPSSVPSWVALAGVCQLVSRLQVLDLWAHRESRSPHTEVSGCVTYILVHGTCRFVFMCPYSCVHISCIGATPLSAFRAAGCFPVLPRHRRVPVPTPARAFTLPKPRPRIGATPSFERTVEVRSLPERFPSREGAFRCHRPTGACRCRPLGVPSS